MAVTTGFISRLEHDHYATTGTNLNVFGGNIIEVKDDFKTGVFEEACTKFTGLNLPARSRILSAYINCNVTLLNAILRMRFRFLQRDGIWNAASFTGWRPVNTYDLWTRIETSSPAVLAQTKASAVSGTTQLHLLRVTSPAKSSLAQSFLTTAGGVPATAKVYLRRFGSSPTGNVQFDIYNVDGNDNPTTLVHAGDARTMASIATSQTLETFTFTSAPSLSSATKYALVMTATYPASDTNYVGWTTDTPTYPSGTYANGIAQSYGTGYGFDINNYLLTREVYDLIETVPTVTNYLNWEPTVLGVQNSPDMTAMFQALVDHASYVNDGTIGMGWLLDPDASADIDQGNFAAYESGTPMTLVVQYLAESTLATMGVG